MQWKKSCLVSKGKRKGELRVSSSAQAGRLAADSTSGSWVRIDLIKVYFVKGSNLYLSDQLVCDFFAEELVRLAMLHVDIELPHKLQHLVHAAACAR